MNPDRLHQNIAVIGGGPAGLTAAARAGQLGSKAVLIEKMDKPGIKLSITGKGRCNITNIASMDDFITRFGKNGKFLRQAFSRFFANDLLHLLDTLGIKTVQERGGRIFPSSEHASDIVDALLMWNEKSGVSIRTRTKVTNLTVESGKIVGVEIEHSTKCCMLPVDVAILATGGVSYPGTGSTGDGYRLAEAAGHTIIPVRQALIPLETLGQTAAKLQGLSLKNVTLSIKIDGKRKTSRFGEMLFTHFGLSGPIVLSLSQIAVDALRENREVEFSIDLKPALDEQKLDKRILRDIREHQTMQAKNLLKGLLPGKLVFVGLEAAALDPEKPVHQISAEERRRLGKWLKNFRFQVKKPRPVSEAIVTAGGIHLKEVNPRTMESLVVRGLYFAGEILDVNADTGGYNLQAAFSTGWLAGESAAKRACPPESSESVQNLHENPVKNPAVPVDQVQ